MPQGAACRTGLRRSGSGSGSAAAAAPRRDGTSYECDSRRSSRIRDTMRLAATAAARAGPARTPVVPGAGLADVGWRCSWRPGWRPVTCAARASRRTSWTGTPSRGDQEVRELATRAALTSQPTPARPPVQHQPSSHAHDGGAERSACRRRRRHGSASRARTRGSARVPARPPPHRCRAPVGLSGCSL